MVILCLNIYPQFIVSGKDFIRIGLYSKRLVRKLPPVCPDRGSCQYGSLVISV